MDNSTAHTGTKSLKIIGLVATGNALNAKARHEMVPLEKARIFTIAFWAKVDAKEAPLRKVSISLQTSDDLWPGFYNKTLVLDSIEWKEYSDTFLVDVNELNDAWPGLCIAESDIDFWIDDFRLFEGGTGDEIIGYQKARLPGIWGKIKTQH